MRWLRTLRINFLECLVLLSVSLTVAAIWFPAGGALPTLSLFFDGLPVESSSTGMVRLILIDRQEREDSAEYSFLLVNETAEDVYFTGYVSRTFGELSPAHTKEVRSDGEWCTKPIWCGNGLGPRKLAAGFAGRFTARQHSNQPQIRIGIRCYPNADPRSSDAYTVWSDSLRFEDASPQ